MRVARWVHLLDEDEEFRRWYENLVRGSGVTADERARVLYRFLSAHGLSLRKLVEMAVKDRRKVKDALSDFVGNLLGERSLPDTSQTTSRL